MRDSEKKAERRRQLLAFACGSAALCLLTGAVFAVYSMRVTQRIDQLVRVNLTAFLKSQKQEALTHLADLRGTSETVALMIANSRVDPEGAWMQSYLQSLSEPYRDYKLSYTALEVLESGVTPETEERDREVLRRLEKGETVVSDIRYSHRLGGGYYFAVAAPVVREGLVIGVVRGVLPAEVLTPAARQGSLEGASFSSVVREDGEILCPDKWDNLDTQNLFDELLHDGIPREQVELLRESFRGQEASTILLESPKSGRKWFFSSVSLGINGWHIIGVTNMEATAQYYVPLVRDFMVMGLMLVAITALAVLAVLWYLNRQRERADLEHARYAALENFADTVLFEYDLGTGMLKFTPNARSILPLEELSCPLGRGLQLLHPEDRSAFRELLAEGPPDRDSREGELRFQNREGESFWCGCRTQGVRSRTGELRLVIGKLADINDRKEKELFLRRQAEVDPLTGVLNKASAEALIGEGMKAGPGVLFVIDIDNFKRVNDTEGHRAGDELLREVGVLLRRTFRERDLVGRVGGDEFVVFLPGGGSAAAADKARAVLERLAELPGAEHGVSASIGIAVSPKEGGRYSSLFEAADRAMYRAKGEGKGAFRFAGEA